MGEHSLSLRCSQDFPARPSASCSCGVATFESGDEFAQRFVQHELVLRSKGAAFHIRAHRVLQCEQPVTKELSPEIAGLRRKMLGERIIKRGLEYFLHGPLKAARLTLRHFARPKSRDEAVDDRASNDRGFVREQLLSIGCMGDLFDFARDPRIDPIAMRGGDEFLRELQNSRRVNADTFREESIFGEFIEMRHPRFHRSRGGPHILGRVIPQRNRHGADRARRSVLRRIELH